MSAAVQVCASLLLVSVLYSFGVAFAELLIPLISWIVSQKQSAGPIDPKGRAVLITGCDTGFGHLLAKQLDQLGFRVFAGCLFPVGQGAQSLKKECSSELNILKLDVTLDEGVAKAKEFVEANLPAKGLWGLVNNAGISEFGEVEWNTVQGYQRLADVNLWGSIRMTLAFNPLIRKSQGRIVFVSTMYASHYFPGSSQYFISKKGLEVFADHLRIEMKKFGVKVSVIKPANYLYSTSTNIAQQQTADEVWNRFSDAAKAAYSKEYVKACIDAQRKYLSVAHKDAGEVTDAIGDSLVSSKPKARYFVGGIIDKAILFIYDHVPACLSDAAAAAYIFNVEK